MRAVTFQNYTDPAGLSVSEISTPEPGPGQVRVRVSAASLNAYDWHMYRGEPLIMRLGSGGKFKEPQIVGADLAGTVDALGEGVSDLSVGDRIMAEPGWGACAQFAVIGAESAVRIPDGVSFEAAAASAMGALTALQALRDKGGLQPGERVLVWGASGGVGHLAIQVALALGAKLVDGVCSGKNLDLVRGLGAGTVFDYTSADQVPESAAYDLILDTVSTQPLREIRRMLVPGGRYVTVGAQGGGKVLGPLSSMIRRGLAAKVLGVDSRRLFASGKTEDFRTIAGWLGDGRLKPVIQKVYTLDQTADACRELEAGHVAGKLVISVS